LLKLLFLVTFNIFSSQLHKGNNNLSIDVYYLAFSFVYDQNTTKNRFLNSKKTRGIGLFSVYATPTERLYYAYATQNYLATLDIAKIYPKGKECLVSY